MRDMPSTQPRPHRWAERRLCAHSPASAPWQDNPSGKPPSSRAGHLWRVLHESKTYRLGGSLSSCSTKRDRGLHLTTDTPVTGFWDITVCVWDPIPLPLLGTPQPCPLLATPQGCAPLGPRRGAHRFPFSPGGWEEQLHHLPGACPGFQRSRWLTPRASGLCRRLSSSLEHREKGLLMRTGLLVIAILLRECFFRIRCFSGCFSG